MRLTSTQHFILMCMAKGRIITKNSKGQWWLCRPGLMRINARTVRSLLKHGLIATEQGREHKITTAGRESVAR